MSSINKLFEPRLLFFLILLSTIFTIGCKDKAASLDEDLSGGTVTKLSSDFLTFYDQFTEDSLFQIDHIIFPLEGIRARVSEDDEEPLELKWEKDTWRIHKKFNDVDETFTRQFVDFNGIVTENISDKTGQFTMIRRFAKIGDQWMLIFYKEMGV
jgi:hypothetical protein